MVQALQIPRSGARCGQKQEELQEVTSQPGAARGELGVAGPLQKGLSSPQVTLRLRAEDEHPPPSLSLTPLLLPLPLPGLSLGLSLLTLFSFLSQSLGDSWVRAVMGCWLPGLTQ